MSTQETVAVVRKFMQEFWNQRNPEAADKYLAHDFLDHDTHSSLVGIAGMKQWLEVVNTAFDHDTVIEDQITENDRSALRITFRVTHIGTFRGVAATGRQAETVGYRFFRVADGKIVEHWATLDGAKLVEQFTAA